MKQADFAQKIFQRNLNLQKANKLESVSGFGSSINQTIETVKIINFILNKFKILTINDCPCGDFNWMKFIDFSSIQYSGFDIVEELIKHNTTVFGRENITFYKFDALNECLPKCDLIVCRDFMFHLNDNQINILIEKFLKSGSKYLLTTSFEEEFENKHLSDTIGWHFRKINLSKEPFNLKNKIASFQEICNKKYLNLYQLNDT